MKYTLTKPCAQCPFRTDVAPFISASRASEILAAIVDGQQSFPCHKTVDYDDPKCNDPDEVHCAGAMILLERINRPNQMVLS